MLNLEAAGILASTIILRAHKFERKSPTTEDKIEKPQKAFDSLTIVSEFLDAEGKNIMKMRVILSSINNV